MAIINLKPFYKEDIHLQKQFRKQVMTYDNVIKKVYACWQILFLILSITFFTFRSIILYHKDSLGLAHDWKDGYAYIYFISSFDYRLMID